MSHKIEWTWQEKREPRRLRPVPGLVGPADTIPRAPMPRMGWVKSEPLGDGTIFVVFGGTDSLYYGFCDAENGDPLFPGPFVVEGGDFQDEATVEHVGCALFRAWKLGHITGRAVARGATGT